MTKPCRAGSSVGVSVARGVEQCCVQVAALHAQAVDPRVCVEPFVEGGREFTAIVLEGRDGPVTLVPSEVRPVLPPTSAVFTPTERELG